MLLRTFVTVCLVLLNCFSFTTAAIQCLDTLTGKPENMLGEKAVCTLSILVPQGCRLPVVEYSLYSSQLMQSNETSPAPEQTLINTAVISEQIGLQTTSVGGTMTCSYTTVLTWALDGTLEQFKNLSAKCLKDDCLKNVEEYAKNTLFVKGGKLDPTKVKTVNPKSSGGKLFVNGLLLAVAYLVA